jgi:hypothetical protein
MPASRAKFCFIFQTAKDNSERDVTATVILREGGVSSTPQLFDSITGTSEYWIARFRGR